MNDRPHNTDVVEYAMKDSILINRDKYIELKAKAEVYDKVLKEHLKMLGVRGGGLYHDFAQFMEMIKTSRKGQMSLYVLKDIQLVILPIEQYKELTEAQKELRDIKCNEINYMITPEQQKKFEKDEALMWKRIVYQIPFIQLIKLLDEQKQYELLEFLKTHVDRNI